MLTITRAISATLIAASLWCASAVPAANALVRRESEPQLTALFLGDSYSVGVGGNPWTNGFVYKVGEHYNWKVFNYAARAVGYLKGDTDTSYPKLNHCLSPQGCRHFSRQYEQALADGVKPDIVFISGGRNDEPGPTFDSAVRALLAEVHLTTPRARIYVTSPINYGPEQKVMQDKVDVVRAACSDAGVTFIDLGAPLLIHSGFLYRDQIHPNDRGYLLLANIIEKKIDTVANSRTGF